MSRSLRQTLIASVLVASAIVIGGAASAATISSPAADTAASAFDGGSAWLSPHTAIDRRREKIESVMRSDDFLGEANPLLSMSWNQYNRFADSSVGALKDIAEELHCLALNIYHEARGEPVSGQRAVGHVVMNRVRSKRYPNSICEVVRQGGEQKRYRCQFSWWCDGRSDEATDRDAYRASMQLALQIYFGYSKDPTGGAMWYHADYVSPNWRTMFRRGPKIGLHIFYQASADHKY